MTAFYCQLPDRGLLAVKGEDSRSFLQGLISNDVTKVSSDHVIYAALLTAQGRYLHDFFLCQHKEELLIEGEKARLPDLLRRLTLYKLRAKVQLRDVSSEMAVFVVFGEEIQTKLLLNPNLGAAHEFGGGIVFNDPRITGLGARLIAPVEEAKQILDTGGFKQVEPEFYHQLRISLGVPDGSRDLLIEKSFLLENNFEELNGVDFKKGCYVGQELTARTKYRGLVRKRLYRIQATTSLPTPGTPIFLGDKEAGILYSSLDREGLALLRLEDVAEAEAEGKTLQADGIAIRPIKPVYIS